ncbi:MAG: hypothetical protein RLZ28_177 [Actinomycetota bacterium]|jgi:transcriptional regulator with XRE-family HTH domain
MVLVRQEIGDVLRDFRQRKGRTLRQVAARASVALGYLSEVERGQKEASSEILASVADALDVPISIIMREVSDRLALLEGVVIPDSAEELLEQVDAPRATFGAAGLVSAIASTTLNAKLISTSSIGSPTSLAR